MRVKKKKKGENAPRYVTFTQAHKCPREKFDITSLFFGGFVHLASLHPPPPPQIKKICEKDRFEASIPELLPADSGA